MVEKKEADWLMVVVHVVTRLLLVLMRMTKLNLLLEKNFLVVIKCLKIYFFVHDQSY